MLQKNAGVNTEALANSRYLAELRKISYSTEAPGKSFAEASIRAMNT